MINMRGYCHARVDVDTLDRGKSIETHLLDENMDENWPLAGAGAVAKTFAAGRAAGEQRRGV